MGLKFIGQRHKDWAFKAERRMHSNYCFVLLLIVGKFKSHKLLLNMVVCDWATTNPHHEQQPQDSLTLMKAIS